MIVLFALAAAVLLFWSLLLLDRTRRWPEELFLDHFGKASDDSVAVLVPARDEASMLPLTLPALLEQEHPDARVVVVDLGADHV